MKFPKINLNNVLEISLAIGLVGFAGIAAFTFAQKHLGFFSYPNMNRQDVLNTVKKVEKKYEVLSRACGDNFCRGIYLTDGNMLYYRLEDDGVNASYQLYQVPSELWSTSPSLLPQSMIGYYKSP